jgi:hypothetical protein
LRCGATVDGSKTRRAGPRGVAIEPALELGEGYEDAAAAAHEPELGEDVLVEVVAADTEHLSCSSGLTESRGSVRFRSFACVRPELPLARRWRES